MNQLIFGPVLSRRLGRSLGIDPIPFKTCTFDCIYCELGTTTNIRDQISNSDITVKEIIKQLKTKIFINPDYITIAGSGEPTLYPHLKDLIAQIKKTTNIPLALITNSSLLWKESVLDAVDNLDLIMPSLDAGDQTTYKKINRPHNNIPFTKITQGLINLKRNFKGKIWLEILFIQDLNTSDDQLKKISMITKQIKPDKILLNSVKRPPAETFAKSVDQKQMEYILRFFQNQNAEIIVNYPEQKQTETNIVTPDQIVNLLKRRGCSYQELQKGLNADSQDLDMILTKLIDETVITKNVIDQTIYYVLTSK